MHPDLPLPDDEALRHSRTLAAHIRAEIAHAGGSIPFSRFMDLCLYAPGLGYYSAGSTKFGEAGDFLTAPESGRLFAATVSGVLAGALRELGPHARVLEVGGGSGAFAEVALKRLLELDALPDRYAILEPSADLRQRQRERLQRTLTPLVFGLVEWLDRPFEDEWDGVLFANEVIDALPTPRFVLRGGEVHEEHVAVDGDGFVRTERPADALLAAAVRHVERYLEAPFAEGGFPTPSGQCEFFSERLAAQGLDGLPDHVPNHEPAGSSSAFPLAMISPPARNFLNSTFVNVKSLRSIEGEPLLEIHADDAGARGIADGAMVRVFNARGEYRCRAEVSRRARPGVVNGLGVWWRKLGADGTNVNQLTSQHLTDIGRGPTFYDCLVQVEPA